MTITKAQFIKMTGEDPVDVLGNDWQEQMEDPGLHDCKLSPDSGCNHPSHPYTD